MVSITDKIAELEEEIHTTKYNKATQHHIGLLKARIARLKADQEVQSKKGHSGPSYAIKKTGDATVLFVGFPSVGKSTLLNKLTNAESKVGEYKFTTLNVVPGMMEYNGAKIQLLDVPGIILGASKGKGRGREIMSVVRNADLILIILDSPGQLNVINEELYRANLRLNKGPPDVTIKKKATGGLSIVSSCKLTHLSEKLAKDILNEYGTHNADVRIREDITVSQLIDAATGNRKYLPAIIVINKSDVMDRGTLHTIKSEAEGAFVISAKEGDNLVKLRNKIIRGLGIIRIYTKKIGQNPDLKDPLILKKDHTVKGACKRIRKEWAKRFQYARVWGKGARFDGQVVGAGHKLKEGDILELHMKR